MRRLLLAPLQWLLRTITMSGAQQPADLTTIRPDVVRVYRGSRLTMYSVPPDPRRHRHVNGSDDHAA